MYKIKIKWCLFHSKLGAFLVNFNLNFNLVNDNKTTPAKRLQGSVGYRKYDASLCKYFFPL